MDAINRGSKALEAAQILALDPETSNIEHRMKAEPSPHPNPLPSHQNGSGEGTANGPQLLVERLAACGRFRGFNAEIASGNFLPRGGDSQGPTLICRVTIRRSTTRRNGNNVEVNRK